MSDRIAGAFAAARAEGRAALVGYLTGHDPDRVRSLDLLLAADPQQPFRVRLLALAGELDDRALGAVVAPLFLPHDVR